MNISTIVTRNTFDLCDLNGSNSSIMDDITASNWTNFNDLFDFVNFPSLSIHYCKLTHVSSPNKNSMKKNRKDHSCGKGIIVKANGIVTNDNPGPPDATLSMARPVLTNNKHLKIVRKIFLLCKVHTIFIPSR